MCDICYGIYSNCPVCGADDEDVNDEYYTEDEDMERYLEKKYDNY